MLPKLSLPFLDRSLDLLAIADLDGHYLFLNPKWEEVTGYTCDELKLKYYYEFVHPDDVENVRTHARELRDKNQEAYQYSYRFVCKNGSIKWLLLNAFRHAEQMYISAHDVTDLKEKELILKEIQRSAAIGFWKFDTRNLQITISDQSYIVLNIPKSASLDQAYILSLLSEEDKKKFNKCFEECIKKGLSFDLELKLISKKSMKWIRMIGHARFEGSFTTEVYGVIQDISEKKVVEEEREYSKKVLATLNVAQQNFIEGEEIYTIFETMMNSLLDLMKCQFGFICEVSVKDNQHILVSHYVKEANKGAGDPIVFSERLLSPDPLIIRNESDFDRFGIVRNHPGIHSLTVLPIFHGLELVGVMGVGNCGVGFTDKIFETLDPFLMVCGQLIEGFRQRVREGKLLGSLSNYRRVLEALNLVTSSYHDDVDLQIQKGLELGCNYLKLPVGILGKVRQSELQIQYVAGSQSASVVKNGAIFDLKEMGCDLPFRLGKAVTNEDLGEGANQVLGKAVKGFVGVPILSSNKRYGILSFFSFEGVTRHFSEYELEFVGFLSRWLGSLLESLEHRKNLEDYRKAVDVSSHVAVLDLKGQVIYVNDKFVDLSGFTSEELLAKEAGIVNTKIINAEKSTLIWETISQGHIWKGETKNLTKNKKEYWLDLTIIPFLDNQSRPYQFICLGYEITPLKVNQTELIKQTEMAEKAAHSRTQFLSNMSHEIRTPLNAILGMADLLGETNLTPDQSHYVDIFKKAGETLYGLVNDILDFSRLDSGVVQVENEWIGLHNLVADLSKLMAFTADQKSINFVLENNIEDELEIKSDKKLIKQILTNLLGNAIKFTSTGGTVSLKVQCSEIGSANGANEIQVSFKVTDTGIGIEQNKLSKIFNPFEQGDASITKRFGGTGLGLAITARLVEMLKGKIQVTSQLGRGSTFSVDFPVQYRTQKKSTDMHVENRFLVLVSRDSNLINSVPKLLGIGGHSFYVVSDDLSFERFKKMPVKFENCVVLIDIVSDGRLDLTEKLRQLEIKHNWIHAIFPSNHKIGDLNTWKEKNLGEPIVQPLSRGELLRLSGIRDREKDFQSTVVAEVPVELQKTGTILIVDDVEDNRFLMQKFLKGIPYEIHFAENGIKAVEKFYQNKYDLIFMDMQMPEMDGLTATKMIRELEGKPANRLPIIALTGYTLEEDIKKSLDAGCDDHLTKPIRKAALLESINYWLKTKKSAA